MIAQEVLSVKKAVEVKLNGQETRVSLRLLN
jgi:hypothetical protein